ncbi:hypothetical protein GLOTRDRAFT_71157 [Gloeophyllum trabeum ATCC 11539]|uniref:HIG1 domain-containing protein n=1 Tax=Gloeophyllum trabeum (strain ATCC 11539 / FP-39264 / Madison 617) TaxID=670483 RepID=S7QK30_GLOTA|nr:uncharacterized protein GLOTRDRAFT_71157 [Gloeophyllum trabeum ATCC 11539]EPQ59588.1 hypothetical protein GLOTRDRAFT_71157 [Gloeophyllum trabeum ATCC 11539]
MTDRTRRREDVDRAYRLQAQAATLGALRYTCLGLGVITLAHYSWPVFRKQTLPFKAFLVSTFTIYGLVVCADTALLSHEQDRRMQETALRREARLDLARRGLVPTETEIAKWKAEREVSMHSKRPA